jgi:hypothetical protein
MNEHSPFSPYVDQLRENQAWYHGTSTELLEAIMMHGLMNAQVPNRPTSHTPNTLSRYAAVTTGYASQATDRVGGKPAIVITHPERSSLFGHERARMPGSTHSINEEGRVPVEHISGWVGGEHFEDVLLEAMNHKKLDQLFDHGIDIVTPALENLTQTLVEHGLRSNGERIDVESAQLWVLEMLWNWIDEALESHVGSFQEYTDHLISSSYITLQPEHIQHITEVLGNPPGEWNDLAITIAFNEGRLKAPYDWLAHSAVSFLSSWRSFENFTFPYPEMLEPYLSNIEQTKAKAQPLAQQLLRT